MSITHSSHEHPLIRVDSRCDDITKFEDVCNGCDTPIMAKPFYKCEKGCNFVLHNWCTRFPVELIGHPSNQPKFYEETHTVVFLPKVRLVFRCYICSESCNGFEYRCTLCHVTICVWCALIPRHIIHKSHPYHISVKVKKRLGKDYCRLCLSGFTYPEETSFSCGLCNFHMHPACALLLPETTRHRYDKHPMALSYNPVENHEDDYFCEVCEEELNPNAVFYHCHECAQSMHTACAPLVPQSKAHIQHVKGYHLPYTAFEPFNRFWKKVAKMTPNLFKNPSSSTVPQGSSTSS